MIESRQAPAFVSQINVLVVDADSRSRLAVADALKCKGYSVQDTASGQEAVDWLGQAAFDLLVLDTNLRGNSGVDLMRRARQMDADLLIVILTAHASVESTIAAIKANVVDYMLKPCNVDDLILTISRALEERDQQLRRQRLFDMVGQAMEALRETPVAESPASKAPAQVDLSQNLLQMGVLSLDRQKRLAILNTKPLRTVELTEGEVSILVALMEKPNQVISCNQLASVALGYAGMDKWTVENVIRSAVFRLRKKLEPDPNAPQLIHTVRGRGYFFSPV